MKAYLKADVMKKKEQLLFDGDVMEPKGREGSDRRTSGFLRVPVDESRARKLKLLRQVYGPDMNEHFAEGVNGLIDRLFDESKPRIDELLSGLFK